MCEELIFMLIGSFFLEDLHGPFDHLWKSSSINCTLVVLPLSCKLWDKIKIILLKNNLYCFLHFQGYRHAWILYFFNLILLQMASLLDCLSLFETLIWIQFYCRNVILDWIWKQTLCRIKVLCKIVPVKRIKRRVMKWIVMVNPFRTSQPPSWGNDVTSYVTFWGRLGGDEHMHFDYLQVLE